MVNLAFIKEKKNLATITKPKKEPSIKAPDISNLKAMMLERYVNEKADEDGMPEGEPLRLIHTALAKEIDAIGEVVRGFGPGAGRLAGEEAGRVARQEMRRLAGQLDWLRSILLAAGGLALLGAGIAGGWYARGSTDTETPAGAMPHAMAERLPLQAWHTQWAACQPQPARGGYEWCLLPFVTKPPKF